MRGCDVVRVLRVSYRERRHVCYGCHRDAAGRPSARQGCTVGPATEEEEAAAVRRGRAEGADRAAAQG